MTALAFWIGYIAFVALINRSPIGLWLDATLDAPDPPAYHPPKRPARAASEAIRVPEYNTTLNQKADQ